MPTSDPVLLARVPGKGVQLSSFDPAGRTWTTDADQKGAPWSEAGFDKLDYLSTIQTADVNGDGHAEVLGRTAPGIATFKVAVLGQKRVQWTRLAYDNPQLADQPWAAPKYFETITTAKLNPRSNALSLVARGAYGMRTWSFHGGRWAADQPYGSYPAIDPAALAAINAYLGIDRGTIRDLYTEPGRDPSVVTLNRYMSSLRSTCPGAELETNPPKFKTCTAPAGAKVSDAIWTAATNQIVAELFWAQQVIDHFTTLDSIQTRLFLDNNAEFPSLARDLDLASAHGAVAKVDYLSVYRTVLEIASGAPLIGEAVGAFSAALEITMIAFPSEGERQNELPQTFADVQRHIARYQQRIRDALTTQRRFILGDYPLLATVGRLISSHVWTIDGQAALSVGREGFTLSMYRAFLPKIWDRWDVTDCLDHPTLLDPECVRPDSSTLMRVQFQSNGSSTTKFVGLVPHQTPCTFFGLSRRLVCRWRTVNDTSGEKETATILTGSISRACRYSAKDQTSWHYGCSLGVNAHYLLTEPSPPSPWDFPTYRCSFTGEPRCPKIQPR